MAPASEDLLGQDAVRDSVREKYRGVLGQATEVAGELYSTHELALVPEGATAASLGVGNPVRRAGLVAGERVIDLGCGAGIDTLLAARLVSPGGRAIGLDMLPEMLAQGEANARAGGITNVDWLRGELESIPLPDASVDVAISNGVLNLSPRKGRAMSEIFRVLRSGGRISLADIVLDEELPPAVMTDPDAWAG
ncbi:MAG TPA: methyltransferase domain-containing protein [Candidatus Limnocylindria bacterium]|jgi:SAM-dependent methyltransferase|nr:methyltransferase domain-containing protein [Candidatus Limnocylindria bacterium]